MELALGWRDRQEMQKRDAKKDLATLCIGGGIARCVQRD